MSGSKIISKRLKDALGLAESYVANYPAACCTGALVIGVFLGWWIKRR
jgi:ElaB/YqjD/DUF883 family membrane-anchored ribosome-binding protein